MNSMIQISSIITNRDFIAHQSWDIVHEWEDILSDQLNVRLSHCSHNKWRLRQLARFLHIPAFVSSSPKLEFVMVASIKAKGIYGTNTIPYIIDYFLPDSEARKYIGKTRRCPLVIISSRQVYERLINLGAPSESFRHVPLSIPPSYLGYYTPFEKKDIDIVIVGRPSEKLIKYANQFALEVSSIKLAVREIINDRFTARVTPPGNELIDIHDRDNYIALLQRSKVFLYSTPGYDDNTKVTNGYSQVTPRLLEALSCGCQPTMCYPDNADTRFYQLKDYWPSVENYDDFKLLVKKALDSPMSEKEIKDYLEPHLTTNIAIKYFIK